MNKNNLVLLLLVICALPGCNSLIFQPSKNLISNPAQLGLRYESVSFKSLDSTQLHAWWLPADGVAIGTVYFLHGNAQNISTHINSVAWLPRQGYQVFLLDYRGFGQSNGEANIPEVLNDIKAGIQWLSVKPEVADKPLYLLGQSLGASLGGYAVGSSPEYLKHFDAIVLDAGFTGFKKLSSDITSRNWLTWPFQKPIKWLMPNNYELINVIANISPTPLLIIHGNQDKIIPFQHGQMLYDTAQKPRVLIEYDGGHIETFESATLRQYLLEFFWSVNKEPLNSSYSYQTAH